MHKIAESILLTLIMVVIVIEALKDSGKLAPILGR